MTNQFYGGIYSQPTWSFLNIISASTFGVKATPGVLHSIVVCSPVAASTVTVYNNTAGSGTKVCIIDASVAGNYVFDADCTIGITVVTVGTANVTVTYL